MASSLVEPSTPVRSGRRSVAYGFLRATRRNRLNEMRSPTQSVNFSGGLAEAVDAGVAEEVPASVNLTRRALRSLGRVAWWGNGGATSSGAIWKSDRSGADGRRAGASRLGCSYPEAARVLGEHLRLLRDSLEHKGLVVDRLEVREESKVESSRLDQHNENDADEDRSRVSVIARRVRRPPNDLRHRYWVRSTIEQMNLAKC